MSDDAWIEVKNRPKRQQPRAQGSASAADSHRLSFSCRRCPASYETKDELTRHIQVTNHYQCHTRGCGRDFNTYADLCAHRTRCAPSSAAAMSAAATPASAPTRRPFMCGFSGCFRTFDDVAEFNRHLAEMRHYSCRVCNERFDNRGWKFSHVCPGPPPRTYAATPAATTTRTMGAGQQHATGSVPPGTRPATVPRAPTRSPAEIANARRERVRMLAQQPDAYTSAGKKRYVFMDTDNIVFSLTNNSHLHELVPGANSARDLRIHFDAFTERICDSGDGVDAPLVHMLRATYFGTMDVLADRLRRSGWTVDKQETVSDLYLHELIQRHRTRNDIDCARTLVLVTGDGNINASGSSFRIVVDQFLQQNWCVEIHAWSHALHEGFIRFMEEYPEHVAVRLLDDTEDAVQELVFAEQPSYAPRVGSLAAAFSAIPSATSVASTSAPVQPPTAAALFQSQEFPRLNAQSSAAAAPAAPARGVTVPPPTPSVVEEQLRVQLAEQEQRVAALRRENEQLQMTAIKLAEALTAEVKAKTANSERARVLQQERQDNGDRALTARWDAFSDRLQVLSCRQQGGIFADPVLLSCCQQTVSRAAYERRLAMQPKRGGAETTRACPCCRATPAGEALPNHAVADAVRVFRRQVPQ